MPHMTTVTHLHPRVPIDTMGARLLLLRHELHWSQRDAAAQTGVSYRTWQGMEAGRETRSLDQHVAAIAETTGYDRDWLMWGGALGRPRPSSPNSDVQGHTVGYSHLHLVA